MSEGFSPIVEDVSGKKKEKGDIGHLLAGIRFIFNNPVTRASLRLATRTVRVRYADGTEKEAPPDIPRAERLRGRADSPVPALRQVPDTDH